MKVIIYVFHPFGHLSIYPNRARNEHPLAGRRDKLVAAIKSYKFRQLRGEWGCICVHVNVLINSLTKEKRPHIPPPPFSQGPLNASN